MFLHRSIKYSTIPNIKHLTGKLKIIIQSSWDLFCNKIPNNFFFILVHVYSTKKNKIVKIFCCLKQYKKTYFENMNTIQLQKCVFLQKILLLVLVIFFSIFWTQSENAQSETWIVKPSLPNTDAPHWADIFYFVVVIFK